MNNRWTERNIDASRWKAQKQAYVLNWHERQGSKCAWVLLTNSFHLRKTATYFCFTNMVVSSTVLLLYLVTPCQLHRPKSYNKGGVNWVTNKRPFNYGIYLCNDDKKKASVSEKIRHLNCVNANYNPATHTKAVFIAVLTSLTKRLTCRATGFNVQP